ncbi:endonuclease domain-containing protein [Paramicrobacterium chengjingii]|uniref:DUF559 domain-containing protein n=1 Tax=Paramicrobacterium chengjingii TaxID=2769067 RepID=A0ABX6YKI3_9MICO|nr:hypothetical protein [Microbacterium chengjingii]QPZ39109.1 hypothetical protein HCR76_03260 [Microbacterium chengjingii]
MLTPLPDRFVNRAFTVTEAAEAGLSPRRLRASDLAMPFPHVRVPSSWLAQSATTTVAEKVTAKRRRVVAFAQAYLTRMPKNGVCSGMTAAYLHSIPLPLRFLDDDRLDFSVPYGARAPQHRGVVGHCISGTRGDITDVDGIPVTTLERTWCDLAAVLDVPDLVAAGDALIHHSSPRSTTRALAEAAGQYPTTRWRARRSEALTLFNDRAESPRESRLRVHLVRAGLPMPAVNPTVFYNGAFMGRVDMLYLEWALIIEYEGEQHLTDVRQWRKDIDRVNDFADIGLRTIRATAADDRDPAVLIERIRAHIATRERAITHDPNLSLRF